MPNRYLTLEDDMLQYLLSDFSHTSYLFKQVVRPEFTQYINYELRKKSSLYNEHTRLILITRFTQSVCKGTKLQST